MREAFTLTRQEYEFFRQLYRKRLGSTPHGPPQGGEPQHTTYVRVTADASSDGWYPGIITVSDGAGDWRDFAKCQLLAINHETLSIGTRYEARRTGSATDGTPRYRCVAAGGGTTGAGCGLILTDGIISLDFEAAAGDGLEVGDPGSGCQVLQLSNPVCFKFYDGSAPLIPGCDSAGNPTITGTVKTFCGWGIVSDDTGTGATYNCESGTCADPGDGTGEFTSLEDCVAACGGGSCPAAGSTSTLVIPDGDHAGTYTSRTWFNNGTGAEAEIIINDATPVFVLCSGGSWQLYWGGGSAGAPTSVDLGPPVVVTFSGSLLGSTGDVTVTT